MTPLDREKMRWSIWLNYLALVEGAIKKRDMCLDLAVKCDGHNNWAGSARWMARGLEFENDIVRHRFYANRAWEDYDRVRLDKEVA